jgi:hypothetical protein
MAGAGASVGERGHRRRSDLDPAGGDERIHIGRVQPHMPANLHIGDSPLRDQPTHEPTACAQALGGLLGR